MLKTMSNAFHFVKQMHFLAIYFIKIDLYKVLYKTVYNVILKWRTLLLTLISYQATAYANNGSHIVNCVKANANIYEGIKLSMSIQSQRRINVAISLEMRLQIETFLWGK